MSHRLNAFIVSLITVIVCFESPCPNWCNADETVTVIQGMPASGDARSIIDALKIPQLGQLKNQVAIGKTVVKYYFCPATLAVIRFELAFPFDKSRYHIVVAPLNGQESKELYEVTEDLLNRNGVHVESLFKYFDSTDQRGMSAVEFPLEFRIRKSQSQSFRASLLESLKEARSLKKE